MASQMVISGANLNSRPVSESAEILEAAPGLAVVQHSGSGKANQYYLRGHNLDHGTDMATFWDDVPNQFGGPQGAVLGGRRRFR